MHKHKRNVATFLEADISGEHAFTDTEIIETVDEMCVKKDGNNVTPADRIIDIQQRYGEQSLTAVVAMTQIEDIDKTDLQHIKKLYNI